MVCSVFQTEAYSWDVGREGCQGDKWSRLPAVSSTSPVTRGGYQNNLKWWGTTLGGNNCISTLGWGIEATEESGGLHGEIWGCEGIGGRCRGYIVIIYMALVGSTMYPASLRFYTSYVTTAQNCRYDVTCTLRHFFTTSRRYWVIMSYSIR